jgi:hypothetical protein
MDKLALVNQSEWFLLSAVFVFGGAAFLWAEYFLRPRVQKSTKHRTRAVDPKILGLVGEHSTIDQSVTSHGQSGGVTAHTVK